jgi:hypothetical protein
MSLTIALFTYAHLVVRRSCSKSWASGIKVSIAESRCVFGARCIAPHIILELSTPPPPRLISYHLCSLSLYVPHSHCSFLHPVQARTGHDPRWDVRAFIVLRRLRALRRVSRHARRSVRGCGHCDPRGNEVGGSVHGGRENPVIGFLWTLFFG